jgi:lipopolysaccharide transport system permease protein
VNTLVPSLVRNKRLLKEFVVRDLKARYVGSSMGFFWSVIFPIINLFVYMFVFRTVLNTRWSDFQGGTEVALVMLAGIVVWSAFAETVSRSTNTLVENSNLIQKVVFPAEVLPVYLATSSLVNMCIGIPVVLLGVVYFNHFEALTPDEVAAIQAKIAAAIARGEPQPAYQPLGLGLPLVALPLLFLLQIVFTVGLGCLLATLNLFLRDIYHLIGVFVTVWMFATPIFYPAFLVQKAGYGWILDLNPMYWLIDGYRAVMIYGAWPDWVLLGKFAVLAVLTFVAGGAFFMAQKPRFPDLL